MFDFTFVRCASLLNSVCVRGLVAAVAFFICLTGAQTIKAQSALDGFNQNANGTVRVVVVQPDGKILIGGEFTTLLGVTRNRIARLNPDGTLDTGFDPNANGIVDSIAVQSDGKVLAGGFFTTIGGQTRSRIARLDAATGLADSFNPNADNDVNSIAVQSDGKILAGGVFATIGGQSRNRIARLDALTGLADSFDPNANGGGVESIAVQSDGKILAGGNFTSIGGQTRNRIARLDAVTGLADSFDPNSNGTVNSIAVQSDGKILAGGNFATIGGQARSSIARLDATTGLADSFNPNAGGGPVLSIAVQSDGKILAGGFFTSIGGQTRNRIARLDAVTGLADSFDPNSNNIVESIAVQSDGKILAGGFFTTIGGQTRNRIARFERDGRLDQTLNLSTVGVFVIATAIQPDGKILIGGRFTTVLGVTRNNIARLNADGTLDTGFNPNADSDVRSFAVQSDGKILAGGQFTIIGGQTRNQIARLDATSGLADSFDPNADFQVNSIAVQSDGKILASGGFTTIGGQTRNGIARLDATSGLADSFDPNADSTVNSIAVQSDGKILAGGFFSNIGGQARNRIARLDATSGLADSFDPNADSTVSSIAVQSDGKILAGGFFSNIGGQTRNFIARLDATSGLADSFDPNADSNVNSIAVQSDGKVLAGGVFTTIGGQARNNIARLDATSGLADSFDPTASNEVYSIAVQADGKILAGGLFNSIGGQARNFFARLSNDTAALSTLSVTNTTLTLTRDGSGAQFARAIFEQSIDNGANYTFLGTATNSFIDLLKPARSKGVNGEESTLTSCVFPQLCSENPFAPQAAGYTLGGQNIPTGQNVLIRARGFYRTGLQSGSETTEDKVQLIYLVGNQVVTTNADSGAGSLRQAVIDACAGCTITFAPALPSPISLSGGQIIIDKDLIITGPGANLLTVQNTAAASSTSRVFLVNPGRTVTISGLTISGGNVNGNNNGGGILNNGTLTVTGSAISFNSADFGGGILNAGTLTVTGSAISNNSANFGGGIFNDTGTLTVTNSTISNNSVTDQGGGIRNSGTVTITNSTISNNSANFGGGTHTDASALTVINSTISNNSATDSGGGIQNLATVNSRNSIIAGNTAPTGPDFNGTLTSQGYNLIGNTSGVTGTVGTDVLNVNPMLGPLANNGGSTQTRALLGSSPAIDRGSFVPGITTDQRGMIRPFDDSTIPPSPGGNNSDIGAFEVQTPVGSPDTTFDGDGIVTTSIGTSARAFAVAIQSDGKIVTAGRSDNGLNNDFALARYNPDGSLDITFDTDGKVITPIGSDNDLANAVAIQADGKIVAAGYSHNGSNFDFALARYNPDGSLDITFDGDGKVTTPIGGSGDFAVAAAIQSDGKIVVAGIADNGSNDDFALARYNPNGSLDITFDTDGKILTPIGSANDSANAVAIQSDGKIVAAGSTFGLNTDFALARYNPDGSLDITFDGDGIVTTPIGGSEDGANAAAIQSDGKIVAAGFAHNGSDADFALARYNPNGSLDTAFDGDGKVTTPIGSSEDSANAVAIQSDGKIVAAGFTAFGFADFALARYNPNGSLDITFDTDGKVITPISGSDDSAQAVAIQTDGKIVAAGYAFNGSNDDFALVRYNSGTNPCVPIPISFGESLGGFLDGSSCSNFGDRTDVYTFTGTAGQQIAITMNSAGFTPRIELFSSQGTVIAQAVSRLPASGFFTLPPVSGTYKIRVSAMSDESGPYTLSLFEQQAAPCTYLMSPLATNVPSTGGSFYFDVLTQTGCPIASLPAISSPVFTVNSYIGGRLNFTVDPYSGSVDRQDSVTIAGQTHTVTQFGITIPGNDNFVNAFQLPGANIPVIGNNTNATAEPGEHGHAGNTAARSVWYRWTAPVDGLYSFSTYGSDFDTVISVYQSATLPTSSTPVIASNDDTTNFDTTSKVAFPAEAGQQFVIAVDGKNGASGVVQISWRNFRRLYRFYTLTANGDPSPRIPLIRATRIGGNSQTFDAVPIALGVQELDLEPDNFSYLVNITSPGITWSNDGLIIDNSIPGLAGTPTGSPNIPTTPTTTASIVRGYIRNLSNNSGLFVRLSYGAISGVTMAPLPETSGSCGTEPVTVQGLTLIRYTCNFRVDSYHTVIPSKSNTAFMDPQRAFPNVVNPSLTLSTADAFISSSAATFNISGRVVTALGAGIDDAVVDLSSNPRFERIRSAPDGSYQFANLPPNRNYTLRATKAGNIIPERTVFLESNVTNFDLTAESCSYIFSGNNQIGAGGGQGSFTVTPSSQGCEWTPLNINTPWLTINYGNIVGNGTVQFTVQPNDGGERNGRIRVGDQEFSITQTGCSFSLSSPTTMFPIGGGNSSFTITTTSGCAWTPTTSDYCMINLSGTEPQTGTRVIDFAVAENLGIPRSATISAAGQTITINQAGIDPNTLRTRFDFDQDGKADIAVYRPSTGLWFLLNSSTGFSTVRFGVEEDIPVAADYDGDGITDIAVYRPSNNVWYQLNSSNGAFSSFQFGISGDKPVEADYDGDDKSDLAIFRPSTRTWWYRSSIDNSQRAAAFGISTDTPVPADYDGDGTTDFAVYRASEGVWYILNSSNGQTTIVAFGLEEDKPVAADYDGDGKAEIAVFRPSTSVWYRLSISNGSFAPIQFGITGDIPVVADYDGDGKADLAVFRPSTGVWYIWSCTNNSSYNQVPFGLSEDKPIANPNAP